MCTTAGLASLPVDLKRSNHRETSNMKTYYAQVSISVSDDVDPKDVFDYVEDAVSSWGELTMIDDASNHAHSCHSDPLIGGGPREPLMCGGIPLTEPTECG